MSDPLLNRASFFYIAGMSKLIHKDKEDVIA